jgi:hypothetical protein
MSSRPAARHRAPPSKLRSPRATAGAGGRRTLREEMDSPATLGAQAVQLLALARRAGSEGLIYAAASEGRAERLGSLLAGLAPDLSVFVLPPRGLPTV